MYSNLIIGFWDIVNNPGATGVGIVSPTSSILLIFISVDWFCVELFSKNVPVLGLPVVVFNNNDGD